VTYGEYLLASYDGVFGAANPDKSINSFDQSFGSNKRRPISLVIPYIYNADDGTSSTHVYLKLYKQDQNYETQTFNNTIYGTNFVYPSMNSNFMGFITIQNTFGAEFSNIVDNYKPSGWST
jgi:hypothetical protein